MVFSSTSYNRKIKGYSRAYQLFPQDQSTLGIVADNVEVVYGYFVF